MGARQLADDGVILGYSGLTTLMPSPQRQRRAIEWLEEGVESGRLDMARIDLRLSGALAEEGLRAEPFEHGLDLFGEAMSVEEPIAPRTPWPPSDETQQLLDRYLQEGDDGGPT